MEDEGNRCGAVGYHLAMPANREARLGAPGPRVPLLPPDLPSPGGGAQARAGQFVMIKAGVSAEPPLRRPFSILSVDGPSFSLFIKAIGPGTRALAAPRHGRGRAVPGAAGQALHPPGPRGGGAAGGGRLRHRPLPALRRGAARARAGLLRGPDHARPAAARALRSPRGASRGGHRGRLPGRQGARDGAPRPHLETRRGRCGSMPAAPTRCSTRWRDWLASAALPAEVSLDPWMGCGIGTCLGCVVFTQDAAEPKPKYRCACTEGPVFDAARVVWPGERKLAAKARGRGHAMSLEVELCGLRLQNPFIAASGTFGYGVEYEGLLDLSVLGGLVSKGLYLEPRDGCPTPRIVETPSGLLNAIGLQGVGVRNFVKDVLPRLASCGTAVLVNVCGDSVEEYAEVSRILDGAPGVAGLEINISCPNVKKGGMAFGGDPEDDPRGGGGGAAGRRGSPWCRSSRPTWPTSPSSPGCAKRRGPTPSPASTPCWAWRWTWRSGRPKLAFGTGRALGPRHPAGGGAHGLAGGAGGEDPGHRHRRHQLGRGRARVPHRGLPRRAGGHRELRRPRPLSPPRLRPPGLPGPPRLRDVDEVIGTLDYPGLGPTRTA